MEECHFLLKPATLLKVTLLHECFPRFLNCTHCSKSHKASHIFLTDQYCINLSLPVGIYLLKVNNRNNSNRTIEQGVKYI